MKNVKTDPVAALVLALILLSESFANVYHFVDDATEGHGGSTVEFTAHLDGSSVGSLDLQSFESSGWMRMDIDVDAMNTTFIELHKTTTGASDVTRILLEGGFGGFEIPYIIHLDWSSFNTWTPRGPYPINEYLYFDMADFATGQEQGVTRLVGNVALLGQEYGFDVSLLATTYEVEGGLPSHFDDTYYPERLDVRLDPGQKWSGIHAEKILELPIEDHVFEIFVTETVVYSVGDWSGEYVPEPATLLLLGLGAVMLRKR